MPTNLISQCRQYQTLKCKSFSASLSNSDNTFMLLDSTICVVKNIVEIRGEYKFVVEKFQRVENLYNVGCSSSSVGVFLCSVHTKDLNVVQMDEIRGKCFRMPYWDCNKNSNPIPDFFVIGLISSTAH